MKFIANKIWLLGFFLLSTTSYTQNYKPLLDNFNEWHFTTCYFGCLTDVYYTNGDTIVNGKNYKVLDGYHYISRTFLLREELAERKVYLNIVNPNINKEYLLYDFSLNEGDVFNMNNPISPFPEEGGPFILDSIVQRPLANGNTYRHFYFSPAPGNTTSNNNAVWVEGVGSLSIINAPGGYPDINQAGHISCTFKNAELFYSNLDSIAVCEPFHLKVEKNNLNKVTLFRKGMNDIYVLNNAENIKSIVLYGISGKELQSISSTNKNTIEIDLSDYKNGMYLLVAFSTNGKKTFKILK